jgi:glycosyltransferase involved in cell wall biosynthesis
MIADKVKALLDEQVRRKCGKHIKELIKDNFAWDGIIDEYVRIYQSLV